MLQFLSIFRSQEWLHRRTDKKMNKRTDGQTDGQGYKTICYPSHGGPLAGGNITNHESSFASLGMEYIYVAITN